MRSLILIIGIGALVLTTAVTGDARAQGKADSPSEVLNQRTAEFAECVSGRGVVKLLLRLALDENSQVVQVEVETETSLSKGSRRCLERVAMQLTFAPDLAGKTIEHELQVVNARGRRSRR